MLDLLSKVFASTASTMTGGVPGSEACIMFLWGEVDCPKELL